MDRLSHAAFLYVCGPPRPPLAYSNERRGIILLAMKEAHPFEKSSLLEILLPPQRIVFIVNPRAGKRLDKRIQQYVDRHLNHRRFIYTIWLTEYAGHATELAANAVKEGYDIVAAVGGDGSVNEVACALVDTDVALAIVPGGTGNGLAAYLGYKRNPEAAIRQLNLAQVQIIDYGLLNNKVFVNIAGVGYDATVSKGMKKIQQRNFWTYFLEAVRTGLSYRPKIYTIQTDTETRQVSCLNIAVANGPIYGFNLQIAPNAIANDGQFQVVLLKDAPRWKYFAAVPDAFDGKLLDASFVEHFNTSSLTISSDDGQQHIHVDGEYQHIQGPLHFRIQERALKVLAPKTL